MTKGDVWLVDIPETVGHEQYGTGPAVVLAEITHYLIVVIVPITKNMDIASAPFTTTIQPSTSNGLTVPSVALGVQIRAVDKRRPVRQLGVHSIRRRNDRKHLAVARMRGMPFVAIAVDSLESNSKAFLVQRSFCS